MKKECQMVKKGLVWISTLFIFLSITSCGLDYSYSLDEDLHNQIERVWNEDEFPHIMYQGDTYVYVGSTNLFRVDRYIAKDNSCRSYKDDILLSWNGYRYFWYTDMYYSYTSEQPLFIYNGRMNEVFFREDYDYLTDTFVIRGTDAEIVWKDMFGDEYTGFTYGNPIEVVVYPKQCPRIKTHFELTREKDQWCIYLPDSGKVWLASDEFIEILSSNGLI